MTATLTHRAPTRPMPGLRRPGLLSALGGVVRCLRRPTGRARRLDPAALSDSLRRDLGLDR